MKYLFATILIFVESSGASVLTAKDVIELLQTSGNRWRQVEAQGQDAASKLEQAQAALSPFVSFSARQMAAKINPVQYGLTPPSDIDVVGIGSVGLQGGIALWDSASSARIDAAIANTKIQAANEKHFKTELSLLALLQLLTLQKIKRQQDVIGSNLDRDLKILYAAKRKFASGFGIDLDVQRAEGLVELQKFKQLEAETAFIKACKDLGNTLTKSDLGCEVDQLKVSMIDENKLEEAGNKYLTDKPDFIASQATVTAAEALVKEAKKESNPKIVLFGETSFVGASIPSGLGHPMTGLAGIQLTIPILSGGLHSGRVQEQSVKVSMASFQRDQLANDSLNQLKVAVAQLKSARAALSLSKRQIEISDKELDFAEKKHGRGSISSLELNTAQINMANAHELNVQVQFAYEAAKLNYCRAIGNLEHCTQKTESEK